MNFTLFYFFDFVLCGYGATRKEERVCRNHFEG